MLSHSASCKSTRSAIAPRCSKNITLLQLESLLKNERERSAIVSEKLQITEAELSERLETIEALKTEMAKHKDVAEKSKFKNSSFH